MSALRLFKLPNLSTIINPQGRLPSERNYPHLTAPEYSGVTGYGRWCLSYDGNDPASCVQQLAALGFLCHTTNIARPVCMPPMTTVQQRTASSAMSYRFSNFSDAIPSIVSGTNDQWNIPVGSNSAPTPGPTYHGR